MFLDLVFKSWAETLRLWPAVPNGTFRELQYDDYIIGSDGEEVRLPKGTYVQINNWCRHRSKDIQRVRRIKNTDKKDR